MVEFQYIQGGANKSILDRLKCGIWSGTCRRRNHMIWKCFQDIEFEW